MLGQHGPGDPLQQVGIALAIGLGGRQLEGMAAAFFEIQQDLFHAGRPLPRPHLQGGWPAIKGVGKNGTGCWSRNQFDAVVQGQVGIRMDKSFH